VSAAGDRALIVIVDRYEWTRHRGWTPRAGLDTRRPRKSPDVMCGCLEGASWLTVTYPPKPSVKLAAAAELRAENGRPVVTLPAGETVSPLSVTGDRTAAIAALPAAAVNAIVEGSIKAGPEGGALQRPMIVKAEWGRGEVERRAETPAGPDGSFRLQSPVNRGFLTVWAESRDGTVLSAREYVRPEPGKTARVELTIQPANWQ
jgi:hypothetical protein